MTTYKEFFEEHCMRCGTQRCEARPEDLSFCGKYHGEIDGIPKIKSLWEEFEEIADWDTIREAWLNKNET